MSKVMLKEKLFPLASEGENEVERLLKRVIDRDKFSYNEAKAYAIIYQNLAPGDVTGKISAMRVKKFMRTSFKKTILASTKRCIYFMDSQKRSITKKSVRR